MAKADIEAVKAAHPILDVLRDLAIPVQHGRIRCLKPENHAHGDRTPSVSIWPDRGQFKCWVCPDVKGDVIDLVRLARNCSFPEALAFLGAAPAPARGGAATTAIPRGVPSAGTSATPDSRNAPRSAPAIGMGSSPAPDPEAVEAEQEALRQRMLASLLEACAPVGGAAGGYLAKRRIFKRTWTAQRLRMIDDYAGVSRKLEAAYGLDDLVRLGFFNAAGHLRFYRHVLLFPYFDITGRAVYLQARAIETDAAGAKGAGTTDPGAKHPGAKGAASGSAKPKELSLAGHIPLPYNSRLLDGEPGQIISAKASSIR